MEVRASTRHVIEKIDLSSTMNLKLDNQLALVTGSTGGIGLEIARSLAGEGARVIINGRSVSSVDGAISAI